VRFSKGTPFGSLFWVQMAFAILLTWNVISYLTILFGLAQKQTGR